MRIAFAIRVAVLTSLCAASSADAASPTCSLAAGERSHEVDVGGVTRQYLVNVGPAAAGRAPLVFLWHGWGDDARGMARSIVPARDWPEAIVVAPQGLPRRFPGLAPRDADGWQLASGELEDRDLAFFDALLAAVARDYCIDRERVYSTGFSNGGFFSNLLGCVRADSVAAIAPVSGGGPVSATCAEPVPVRITHGRRDEVIPYERARQSFAIWSQRNGCEAGQDPPDAPPGVGCRALAGCAAPVELCAHGGRHTWPPSATRENVRFFRGLAEAAD